MGLKVLIMPMDQRGVSKYPGQGVFQLFPHFSTIFKCVCVCRIWEKKEGKDEVDDEVMKSLGASIQGLSPSNDPPQVSKPNLKFIMIMK